MLDRPFAAVLGKPIAHSLSPILHLAAYRSLGLDWDYRRYELAESELSGFLADAPAELMGCSVTMPLKPEAFRLAVCDDPAALATGACNTLVRESAGWRGYNTDVAGFVAAIRGKGLAPASALVLGAGATARSALVALLQLGVTEIRVAARRLEAAEELLARYQLPAVNAMQLATELPAADLVVSTLPAGAADELQLAAGGGLFDVVYAPWPSRLATAAAALGMPVVSGLELLVEQAVVACQLQTRCADDQLPVIRAAMYEAGQVEQARRSS